MPRDGSGIYTTPVGTTAVPDTTIESAKYNNNVADVAADLNAPRPIVAGGTGANNAVDAAINLGVVSGKTAITYTEAEKAVARNNIAAAPFDALAYNGMQINGSMEVSQEKGTAGSGALGYINDGWQIYFMGTMLPYYASSPHPDWVAGIPSWIEIALSTAQPALGAADSVQLYQAIEGYRIARLHWGYADAKPISIGFWTMHVRTGLYSVVVRNSTGNRNYATTYTHNVGGTPQYNVVTIPGCTDGVWSIGNTIGMYVIFTMAAGSSGIAPTPNVWLTATYAAAPGQINGVAAATDVFRITGVVVLPGTQAPTAAQSPLIMRPYDQELAICQRYWQKVTASMRYYATVSTQNNSVTYPFLAEMRAAPTITLTGAGSNSGNLSDFTLVALDARTAVLNIVGTTGDIYSNGRSWSLDARL